MKLFSIEIPEKIKYLILLLLFAYLAILLDKIVIDKIVRKNNSGPKHLRRSQNTILLLLKRIIKYAIIFVTIISVLKMFGLDTTILVTSVGALTVIIGLAFQDVLKDYLVGIFIILESQFAIGEIVEIDGFKGEVIYLGLKTTKIKSPTGEIKIISNRNITEVINYSLSDSLIMFDVSVSYEDDNKKVEKVLTELAEKLPDLVDEINKPVTLNGIDQLSDSAVIYRMSTYARDRDRFVIKRKVNAEIKKTLDKNKIKIPYPQIEVHNEK